ncbi:hypothetical protein L1987_83978 [Smallanthus sonchifolius]|uniref:Uncharacterized protein n=1 Tax=Smallanthus sonchifolius TaxID=185202 RepID=A0ACB8YE05_9ASTR|nr:hypothetical protein L1987_83978 [Smallanthus sonchifolius]
MHPCCLRHLLSSPLLESSQQTDGSVSVDASLTATPDAKPWFSSSGEFAWGFKQVQDNFLLSIWYDMIDEKTIICDPQGKEVWSSGIISDLSYGYMNDTGNFVIVGSNSSNIWESFDHPADTMLPTQVMARGGVINSKIGKTNFTGGKFQLRLLPDGNLVLNTRDTFTGTPDAAYYISGTRDASNSTNSGFQLLFDATGYIYVLRGNGEKIHFTPIDSLPSGDYYHRATLDSDGVFTQYYYPKNPTEPKSWKTIYLVPENICTPKYSKACGLNNICSLDGNRPNCECPQGFSLVDPNIPNIASLISLQAVMKASQIMEEMCLNSSSSQILIGQNLTMKKQLPLANGFKDPSDNVKAFFKFMKIDGPSGTGGNKSGPGEDKSGSEKDKSGRSLIFVGSVLLGMFVLGVAVLIGVIYVCFFQIHKKKAVNPFPYRTTVETNLPRFTYQELVTATHGFKDELGKGAFGIISCRKSLVFDDDAENVVVLTDLAWDCYQEGRVDAFVENDLEALDDFEKLATYMMVGLWCVQENPLMRPTMKKVIQMLEGGTEVTEPPCPFPLSVTC